VALKKWEVDDQALAQLMLEPGVAAHLEQVAELGVEAARALAPVGHTGEYRDSLIVQRAQVEGGELAVGFGSTSWKWHFVEFGTRNNSPYAVLRNAANAVADRLEIS
jgi:HK97 gp10 family phage protein